MTRFSVIPAAYVVVHRGSGARREVLLQLRRGTGYMDEHWAVAAAGHVELGESVLAAAAREAREELGIRIDERDLVGLTGMHRTGVGGLIDERVDWFFACERWAGEPVIQEQHKAAELRWFDLDALPTPVVPHEHAVLKAWHTGTLPPPHNPAEFVGDRPGRRGSPTISRTSDELGGGVWAGCGRGGGGWGCEPLSR